MASFKKEQRGVLALRVVEKDPLPKFCGSLAAGEAEDAGKRRAEETREWIMQSAQKRIFIRWPGGQETEKLKKMGVRYTGELRPQGSSLRDAKKSKLFGKTQGEGGLEKI